MRSKKKLLYDDNIEALKCDFITPMQYAGIFKGFKTYND